MPVFSGTRKEKIQTLAVLLTLDIFVMWMCA